MDIRLVAANNVTPNSQDPTKLPCCKDIAFGPINSAINPIRQVVQTKGPPLGKFLSSAATQAGRALTWVTAQVGRIPEATPGDIALYAAAASGMYALGANVQALTQFVTNNAPVLTFGAVDALLLYGVVKETAAAAKGQCIP